MFNNYSKPTTTVDKVKVNYFRLSFRLTHRVEATGRTICFCFFSISHVQCVLNPNYG